MPYGTDANGNPNVFNVERNADGAWLNANNAHPDNRWNSNNRFAFAMPRKLHPSVFPRGLFFSCLIHPPSCLPIVPSCTDKLEYLLLSRAFISQAKRSRNFKESSFVEMPCMADSLSLAKKVTENKDSNISTANVSIRKPNECLEAFGKCVRVFCQSL